MRPSHDSRGAKVQAAGRMGSHEPGGLRLGTAASPHALFRLRSSKVSIAGSTFNASVVTVVTRAPGGPRRHHASIRST